MVTPLGARRGFVVFVTFFFAVLALAEAGAVALDIALDNPAGLRLTVVAALGAPAFAALAVMYARQWRRIDRPARRIDEVPAEDQRLAPGAPRQAPGRRPSSRYAIGPTGWTKMPRAHSARGPRTPAAGRRARSAAAVAVSVTSTAAPTITATRAAGDNSLHRRFALMDRP